MYHVALELTQEQVKQLRLRAVAENQTVKSFIASLVTEALKTNPGSVTIRKQKEEKNK